MKESHRIIMSDHTIVLGWSDKTLFLLRERLAAAENLHGGLHRQSVIVLADRDELDMWCDIRDYCPADFLLNHNIRVEKGRPSNPNDLGRVSIGAARDVGVLGASGSPHESDIEVMQIMVALGCLQEEVKGSLVAEVRCFETCPKIKALLGNNACGVPARAAVNNVLCLMATQPGLGSCLSSLCSFAAGVEFYSVKKHDAWG